MYGLKPVPFSASPLPWAAHKTIFTASDQDGLYQGASGQRSARTWNETGENDEIEPICATAVGIFDAYAAWFSESLPRLEAADD
jgi:hypothetical protein